MEDIIKDEILGELDFQDDSWVGELDSPFLNSDGNLMLVVQDNNKEGILDVQREAYKTYMQNEEKYKSCVTDLLLHYYKWNYECIARIVYDLTEDCHKDIITEKELYKMIDLWYLFICRDGSFGYAFGCCWEQENDLAVLLSESEPRVISRTQLENLHKLNDPTVGLLVHDGKKAWKGLEINSFFGKPENLEIELEGAEEEGITEDQRNAYADYLSKKDELFAAFSKMMLGIYTGSEEKAEEMLKTGVPINVKTILPKTLYIDREGNYGWICYTEWDKRYVDVLLSENRPYIMKRGSLRSFSNAKTIIDEEMGLFFTNRMSADSTIIVKIDSEILTVPFNIEFLGLEVALNDKIRNTYRKFIEYNKTFWKDIPLKVLGYYYSTYEEFEEAYEVTEELQENNVDEHSVMSLANIRKLYMTYEGRAAWLCEFPTAQDGLAFEFTDGWVDMIPQYEII